MDHDEKFRWETEEKQFDWDADKGDDVEYQKRCRSGWQDDWLPFVKKSAVGIGIVAVAVGLWTGGNWLLEAAGPQDVRVELLGSGVGLLKPGARVVLGSTEVGQVEQVGESGGEATALVRVEKDFVSQISQSSGFEVDSLNDWLPGNVGVRVRPALSETRSPLVDGTRVRVAPRALPPWAPWGFYVVIAASVVVLAGVVVVAWMMRRAILLIVFAAIFAGIMLYLNGIISPP